MNQQVIEAIDVFNKMTPDYINGVVNINDRKRLYDIAVAVYETKESLEDTKQYLREHLSDKFTYREKVLNDCINNISVIYMFLDYYNQK